MGLQSECVDEPLAARLAHPSRRAGYLRCIHHWVTDQTRSTPGASAICYRDQVLTYAELESRCNRVAHVLRRRGVVRGSVVGVCLEPSPDVAIAILAIWKLGAIYLPLEPSYPIGRLDELVKDADCSAVVLTGSFYEVARDKIPNALYLDAAGAEIEAAPAECPPCEMMPEDLAYLIYTSGSTGRPKGVMVSHRALASKLGCVGTWGVLGPNCRAAWLSSMAFDASLAQIFLPLAHGGCVVVVDGFERLAPGRVWALLRAAEVNVLDCTPSWLLAMLDAAPPAMTLQRIVLGGETLTSAFAQRVRDAFPHAVIVNIYGPTEACIDAAAHALSAKDFDAEIVPIGKALPGYTLAVLNDAMQPVPHGAAGEIYIGGPGLAEGYWKLPQATAERFAPRPFPAAGGRWYRTGDLARQRSDGALEFLGRADHQIKIRGQRIELGEIEFALSRLAHVSAAVVKNWPAADGTPKLVAYVARNNASSGVQLLRDELLATLPRHMVPDEFIEMRTLPLLPSGKVDRSALPHPPQSKHEVSIDDLPRSELERDLVRIWADVLGFEQIGIHDNFFELGGHSLLAVKLIERINSHCAADLPLTLLFTHSNVADLALAVMRGPTAAPPSRTLFFSNKSDHRTPLFLLPPVTGLGMVYAGLAREIAQAAPTVALQAVGWSEGPVGTTSMAELAATFIQEILKVQARGPWRLCGYSAGGAIGHEMVRQMQTMGHSVSHLFLIDPYCNHVVNDPAQPTAKMEEQANQQDDLWIVCRDMVWDTMGLRDAAADPVVALARRLCSNELGVTENDASAVLPRTMNLRLFKLLLDGLRNSWSAYAPHRIEPLHAFEGQAWLIQPDADRADLRTQRFGAWRCLIGANLQPIVVPGEHSSMLNRSHSVRVIGLRISERL